MLVHTILGQREGTVSSGSMSPLSRPLAVRMAYHRCPVATRPRLLALLAPLAISLVLVTLSGRALAFCRTTTCAQNQPPPDCVRDSDGCWAVGLPLYWEQECVSFSVSGRGSPLLGLDYPAAEELVQSAFNLWVNASCPDGPPSIAVSSRGPLSCERREFNRTGPNANAILFRDESWAADPAIIALTTVAYSPTTGKLLNADIEINSFTYDQLGLLELRFMVAHEAGHFFGLDHSPDPTGLMFYRDSFDGSTEPALGEDDLAGLCAIYPTAREVPACDFEPPRGFATDCGGNVTAACAVPPGPAAAAAAPLTFLLLLALASVLWLRRRG